MGVGGKVGGEIPLNMPAAQTQCAQKIFSEGDGDSGTLRQQLVQPNPGQAAERDFEAAGPVRSQRIRIGTLPGIPLREDFVRIGFLASEKPGLRQRDQVLMAAQLPSDLVIADLGKIEEVDFEPRDERRVQAVYCVEMPINFGAVIEILVSQESKTVDANLFRFRYDVLRLAGQIFLQKANAVGKIIGGKEKPSRSSAGGTQSVSARLQPHSAEGGVEPLGNLLAHASLEFVPTHMGQTRPESSSGNRHKQSLSSTSRYTPI